MKTSVGKQWLICLCAACMVACSMESAPTGACGDLGLGYSECQCTAPTDAYSRDSIHSSYHDRRELADCKAGSSLAYAIKGLKDNEIYACIAYRCAKATCPEGLVSSEDQESCVEPPKCCKGEVPEKNACACDTENHWTGKAGSCACDEAKGFIESVDNAGICVCRKDNYVAPKHTGICELKKTCEAWENYNQTYNECDCDLEKAYVDSKGACVKKPDCDPVTEIYKDDTHACDCNTAGNWMGTSPNCTCGGGNKSYVIFTRDGKTMCDVQAKCKSDAGQKYVSESNTCACDAERHWTDDGAGACKCDDEHRVANADGDCVCDTENHWFEDNGTCVEKNCYNFNNQCAQIKGTVTFGHYKQSSLDDEPISWIVLDAKQKTQGRGGKLLLLSQYVLDAKPWNAGGNNVWSTSSIRAWLNSDFKNDAFNRTDQGRIEPKSITSSDGSSTEDSVFLLSIEDVEGNKNFFENNKERKAQATMYALKQNVYVDKEEGTPDTSGNKVCAHIQCSARWWLRSPGDTGTPGDTGNAAYIRTGGGVTYEGYSVSYEFFGVRPAVWVLYE